MRKNTFVYRVKTRLRYLKIPNVKRVKNTKFPLKLTLILNISFVQSEKFKPSRITLSSKIPITYTAHFKTTKRKEKKRTDNSATANPFRVHGDTIFRKSTCSLFFPNVSLPETDPSFDKFQATEDAARNRGGIGGNFASLSLAIEDNRRGVRRRHGYISLPHKCNPYKNDGSRNERKLELERK